MCKKIVNLNFTPILPKSLQVAAFFTPFVAQPYWQQGDSVLTTAGSVTRSDALPLFSGVNAPNAMHNDGGSGNMLPL